MILKVLAGISIAASIMTGLQAVVITNGHMSMEMVLTGLQVMLAMAGGYLWNAAGEK